MTHSTPTTLPGDVRLVDDLFLGRPHLIGTYVLLGSEPALVDPGPASTIDNLTTGLATHSLALDDVRAILLTHIHLDHAGATGLLVSRHPHLQVYVHEIGAPHVIDPGRLIHSAARLYGNDMDRLWGEIRPVPQDNVTALGGGETIHFGRRTLRALYTPGHASHHVTYFDEGTAAAFAGDVTGVRLPDAPYVHPATPPPDIDLEAWQASLDALQKLEPSRLLLTHFGPGLVPTEHIEQFRGRLLRWAEAVREGLRTEADESVQIARLKALVEEELPEAAAASLRRDLQLVTPIEQNWQGLARYWRKYDKLIP